MVRSTLCERKSLVSLWLEIQPPWADIGILPQIEKFSSCVKDDWIFWIGRPVYFSWRIYSLNFIAGSDLEIENFWPNWVLWKIVKNQFSPIFNLSPYLWTGSIRDQYSYRLWGQNRPIRTRIWKTSPATFLYMLNIFECEAHWYWCPLKHIYES